jgi:site-specific DNA-methyltransferase (adenine-specific)
MPPVTGRQGGGHVARRTNRIIHGDCLKVLERLEVGSVDLAFADPPFNIGYEYDEYHDKRSCEDYLDWSRRWISAVLHVLKPDGTFWLAIGDEYAAELKVMATRELDLTCRSWVVWYYTFGVHCKHKFTRSHAHLFYFVKDPKAFTFNSDTIRVPSARQLVYGDKRANPKGRVPDDTWIIAPAAAGDSKSPSVCGPTPFVLRPQDLPDGFTPDSDTWYFPRVCGTFKERGGFHGCQMPEQLLGRIIKACSNEGDLVLDPFAGSATTLAVAKKLGRQYLGIELSKQYVNASRARLRRVKPGDPLDGFEDPLTSAPDTQNGVIRTADGKRVKRKGPAKRPGRPRKRESSTDPTQMKLWK